MAVDLNNRPKRKKKTILSKNKQKQNNTNNNSSKKEQKKGEKNEMEKDSIICQLLKSKIYIQCFDKGENSLNRIC